MILLLLILIKCCDKSTWQESSGTHWSPCRQEGEGNILSKRMLETFNIEGWVGWVWLDIGMVAGWGEALATVNSGSTLKTFDFESAISTEKTWILDKRLAKGYISSQPGRKWEIMIWWTLSHWRTQAPLLVSEHLPWLPAGTSMFSYFWDDPSRIPLSGAPLKVTCLTLLSRNTYYQWKERTGTIDSCMIGGWWSDMELLIIWSYG